MSISEQRLAEIRGHVARKDAPWTEQQMLEALLAALAHAEQASETWKQECHDWMAKWRDEQLAHAEIRTQLAAAEQQALAIKTLTLNHHVHAAVERLVALLRP